MAAEAGVGVGTVSRVLNGGANVREATRRKVLEVMGRLGYRPSHLAAALSRGTPRTVAVVVPYLTRPSVVVRLAGALAVFDERGYDTVVCNVETPQQRDRHLKALVARHRADGVVVVSLHLTGRHLFSFGQARVPMVMIDAEAPGVPRTVIDDVLGGRLATEHLLSLGHRRIGFVGDSLPAGADVDLGFVSSRRRLDGYRRALRTAGIGYDPALVKCGSHDAAVAAELAAGLLALPSPPSGIFAASDTQAIGVLTAADKSGVRVPDQLSVIGFDDIEAAALLGLSTVRQPLKRSGAEAAGRLCALLSGTPVRPMRQELALEVVRRSSSAACARAAVKSAARGSYRPAAGIRARAARRHLLHDHPTTAGRMTRR
ncbi:MAG TPA: LacI family DNA-binding transcriptional regulator [Streptosporangiaceae bacterium]|nr:LacI family DNA-binding transcriptional regulator [Streptosporangiaceae bacterium]